MKPIFVPSKNRAFESPLLRELQASQAEYWYVIEPQDKAKYQPLTDNLLILPENDRGLCYVRNWIDNYCKQNDIDWYWMLDDDVKRFYKSVNGKNHPETLTNALSGAEKILSKHMEVIGQASLEYQQFAWSARKKVAWQSYCDVVVLNKSTLPISFRSEFELKVDRDYTLQVQSLGYQTARVTKYSFAAPKIGSNSGGLNEVYADDSRIRKEVNKMCELWPGICFPKVKNSGMMDVKINWLK